MAELKPYRIPLPTLVGGKIRESGLCVKFHLRALYCERGFGAIFLSSGEVGTDWVSFQALRISGTQKPCDMSDKSVLAHDCKRLL